MSRLLLSVLLLMSLSVSVSAQTKVVVIPMAGDAEPLQNVLTVSKRNGDFTSIEAALGSITDSSDTNPYLVAVGPGRYSERFLAVPAYVTIAGSGRNATFIDLSSSVSPEPIRTELGNTELRDLSMTLYDSPAAIATLLLRVGSGGNRLINLDVTVEEGLSLESVIDVSSELEVSDVSLFSKSPNTFLSQSQNSRVTIRDSNFSVRGPFIGNEKFFVARNARTFTMLDTTIDVLANQPFKSTLEAISHDNTNQLRLRNVETGSQSGVELTLGSARGLISDSRFRDINILSNTGALFITDTTLTQSVTGENANLFCDNVLDGSSFAKACVIP